MWVDPGCIAALGSVSRCVVAAVLWPLCCGRSAAAEAPSCFALTALRRPLLVARGCHRAKMNDLNAMVERERRQKEKYRALASASASAQGSCYSAASSSMLEHVGMPNALGTGLGVGLGGAGSALDSTSSNLGGAAASAPGMEHVLREARRELEAVKATSRQISLEIMLQQRAPIPPVGCGDVSRWSADSSACASSCAGAMAPHPMQIGNLSAASTLSTTLGTFAVAPTAGHSTLMGTSSAMTARAPAESARPSTPPAVAPLSAEPSM